MSETGRALPVSPERAAYEAPYRFYGTAPGVPFEELGPTDKAELRAVVRAVITAYAALPARRPQAPGSVPWQAVNAACMAAGLEPEHARKILEAAAPHMNGGQS